MAAEEIPELRDGIEPIGGQPPKGSTASTKDFDYQIKYQRAFEAVLWSMPATGIYGFRRAVVGDLGLKEFQILAYSEPATPRLEALTANTSTPYIAAFADLRNGPVVVDLPAASSDGSLYGQVVDAWQVTLADVGPAGLDRGGGGKYLFTPPEHKEPIPQGYFHVASASYRITLAFRSIIAPGKTARDAYAYSKRLRIYPLSQAINPPEQEFLNPLLDRVPTLPFYDERYFNDLYDVVSVEPVREQDKAMMGFLKTLGIEKGRPFAPDGTTKAAMRQAGIDAWHYLQQRIDTLMASAPYWPDRHYASLVQTDANRTFSFAYEDYIDVTARAVAYFWGTMWPSVLSDTPATQYLLAFADKGGRPLQTGKLYKLDVPAEMPVRQFWALTLYDRATFSFVYSDSGRTTLSSYDVGSMKKNPDGSVTIYVGPKAPEGLESNSLPTVGKRPLPCLRFYGPTDAFNNKTFKLSDFEELG